MVTPVPTDTMTLKTSHKNAPGAIVAMTTLDVRDALAMPTLMMLEATAATAVATKKFHAFAAGVETATRLRTIHLSALSVNVVKAMAIGPTSASIKKKIRKGGPFVQDGLLQCFAPYALLHATRRTG